MLTLLCTAPSSSVGSPIETFPPTHLFPPPPPPPSSGSAGSGSSLARMSGRKFSIRRPSIRKRIQSISRASGASPDKATTTPSNAAGKSTFSFFRHTSSGSRSSNSAGNVNAASTSGSVSAHMRGASMSSFMSGRSGRSNKSSSSSGDGHGRGGRLNVLNIGPPTSFKHRFHLGPDSTRRSDQPCDETRWRQVGIDHDDTPVIDVVPPTDSTGTTESRKSSSSDNRISYSRSPSGASASSPNLLSVTTVISTSNSPPSSSSSPSPASASASTTPANDAEPDKAKAAKQTKRTSLVKRKPVPKLDPEELESLPRAASPVDSPAPATYVLVPDPIPGEAQTKVPETAPAGKTSFEVQKSEGIKDIGPAVSLQKGTSEETKKAGVKQETPKESFVTSPFAPEHIYILHPSPAPTPPPRRHTLAHMQARALGRGKRDAPSLLSGPSALKVPASMETQEKKEKKPRPMPIVAPSPAAVEPLPSPIIPLIPPGLSAEEKENANTDEKSKEAKPAENPNVTLTIDNSPRPSLSSLAPSSEGSETVRSASSRSSTESGEVDLDMEPRTPTDEKRSSAGSVSFIKPSGNRRDKGVRIVLPGDFPVDNSITEDEDDEAAEREMETPRVLRRASKRPNPPVRRAQANEESVYVTADEADDV